MMKPVLILTVLALLVVSCRAQASISIEIDAYAQSMGLSSLEKTSFAGNDYEARIWIGFSLFTPRLFLFHRDSRGSFASYYSVDMASEKIQYRKTSLHPPKSGWNNFRQYLIAQQTLLTGKPYPAKEKFTDPDEKLVVIEMKTKNDYLLAAYPVRTINPRGEKVLDICRKIEKDYLRHEQYGYIGFIYVVPEHRGRGVSRRILERLEQWAITQGVTEIRLEVYRDNSRRSEPAKNPVLSLTSSKCENRRPGAILSKRREFRNKIRLSRHSNQIKICLVNYSF